MKHIFVTVLIDRSSSTGEFIPAVNEALVKLVSLFNSTPETKGVTVMLSVAQFPVFSGEDTYILRKENMKDKKKYTFNIYARGNTDPIKELETVAEDLIADTNNYRVEKSIMCADPLLIHISDGELNAGTNIPGGIVDPVRQQRLLQKYEKVCNHLKTYQKNKKINFFAFGLKGADEAQLRKLTISAEQVKPFYGGNVNDTVTALFKEIYECTLRTLDQEDVIDKEII